MLSASKVGVPSASKLGVLSVRLCVVSLGGELFLLPLVASPATKLSQSLCCRGVLGRTCVGDVLADGDVWTAGDTLDDGDTLAGGDVLTDCDAFTDGGVLIDASAATPLALLSSSSALRNRPKADFLRELYLDMASWRGLLDSEVAMNGRRRWGHARGRGREENEAGAGV